MGIKYITWWNVFFCIYITILAPGIFAQSATRIKILFLGDSLTEGFGVPKNQAFPSIILEKLEREYKDKGKHEVGIINGGISGSTSASALKRLKWQIKANPTHLVLALGANDGLRGLPPESTEDHLEKAIEFAVSKNIPTLLCGMAVPPNYGEQYGKVFSLIFTKVSKKYKTMFMPFLLKGVGGERPLNQSDGIHPNEKGHQVIAENLWPYIQKLINTKGQQK